MNEYIYGQGRQEMPLIKNVFTNNASTSTGFKNFPFLVIGVLVLVLVLENV